TSYASLSPGGTHAVWGTGARTGASEAAFANGVACRYLDYNDSYYGVEPIHPSDVIPMLHALAVTQGADEAELVEAVAIAYEVAMSVADVVAPRERGFD